VAQSPLNGTTQPVEIEEEGRSSTTDRRRLKENKIKSTWSSFIDLGRKEQGRADLCIHKTQELLAYDEHKYPPVLSHHHYLHH